MAGNIYINEDAANADIAKIRAAITRLEEAQSGVKKLSNSADNMTGQTGEAIEEKCTTLDSQIQVPDRKLKLYDPADQGSDTGVSAEGSPRWRARLRAEEEFDYGRH